ncbi:uncharacterized protein PGTG_02690 [Puccinia graminis f. sp. tritici CRL 75-36-700-3]|uniref:Uncharacterized protein n=1 Tax=Puccinia graminis f. sp. tritici (strain CRL 75-36-700-3 / race SCCL) TaxID=418459 RepID=E3JW24_PUCGT|nr:uncharacterized protein PGTG_02690 [Puccinia graminis f. sp. tritici CRL 75-36-700-3]EFP76249.1 hypothetical protein PGTG_02690 [Puccinia graminis f. sp. tritici CRL 75-36-700-3]
MPINLYSDDTSGNISKQFNKHASFYFTLSGLPPNVANQEFNCHFVTTSNQAGVLELADKLTDEINDLATFGHVAYDHELCEEVLIMSVVLCFQADLPMHAEITCTHMPNASLNPCRMCKLKAQTIEDRKSISYIQNFIRRNTQGHRKADIMLHLRPKCRPSPRLWRDTKMKAKYLWKLSKTEPKTLVDNMITDLGVKDNINKYAMDTMREGQDQILIGKIKRLDTEDDRDQLFSPIMRLKGFDGCLDTPVEILHVFLLGVVKYLTGDFMKGLKACHLERLMASWESFNKNSLNIETINSLNMAKHHGSFLGKHFRIVLQAAPFVFYQFMTEEQRHLWISMCQLSTYIFQTRINDMDKYLTELNKSIDNFMWHITKTTCQWVNKPKLHMLLHLPECIQRFGPATLYATEKFKSFNGVLRNASIHSNRHSPGQDIATKFVNDACLRSILSGGLHWNHRTHGRFRADPQVTAIFQNNPAIQNSLGYNHLLVTPQQQQTCVITTPLPKEQKEGVPDFLQRIFFHQLKLFQHDVLKKDYFVLVKKNTTVGSTKDIECVESIWSASLKSQTQYFIKARRFSQGPIHPFYHMKELYATNHIDYFEASDICACLNVQHNCQSGRCQVARGSRNKGPNYEGNQTTLKIRHNDKKSFILNSASLRDPVTHRELAGINTQYPLNWATAIGTGRYRWKHHPVTQTPQTRASSIAPSLI